MAQGYEPAFFTTLFASWARPVALEAQLAQLRPAGALAPDWPLSRAAVAALHAARDTPHVDDALALVEPGSSRLLVWEIARGAGEPIRQLADEMRGVFRSDA